MGLYFKRLCTLGRYFIGKNNKEFTRDRFIFLGRFKDSKKERFDTLFIWNFKRRDA